MARSYRTQPKWKIAARNIGRNSSGEPILPRVVVRRPHIGDGHPLSKGKLVQLLRGQPLELVYGLRLIEMRARQGVVGHPFAAYSPRSKTIRLYSLPLQITFTALSQRERNCLDISGASIENVPTGFLVSWPDWASMGFWFYHYVFLHELGHHHRMQYPYKTGRPRRRSEEEFLADRESYWIAVRRF